MIIFTIIFLVTRIESFELDLVWILVQPFFLVIGLYLINIISDNLWDVNEEREAKEK